MKEQSYNMNREDRIATSLVSVIKRTHSIISPHLPISRMSIEPPALSESLWPGWQMGGMILDQCSLCMWSRSPLPLDLSVRVSLRKYPASEEGACMRANLHLHCCKLRTRNEALGETAARCLQGQS